MARTSATGPSAASALLSSSMRSAAGGAPASGSTGLPGSAANAAAAAVSDPSHGKSSAGGSSSDGSSPGDTPAGGSASSGSSERAATGRPGASGAAHRASRGSTPRGTSSDDSTATEPQSQPRSHAQSDLPPAGVSTANADAAGAGGVEAAAFSLLLHPEPAGTSGESRTTAVEAPAPRDTGASEDLTAWVTRVMPSLAPAISPAPTPASAADAAAAATAPTDALAAIDVSADGGSRSSGAQRALQTLLAEAGRSQSAGATNSTATLAATRMGATPSGFASPPVPSPDGVGIDTGAQQGSDGRAPATGSGGPGTPTSAASTMPAESALTAASTAPTASTLTAASTLDAASALSSAGAAPTGAIRTTAAADLAPTSASNNPLSVQPELRAAVGTSEWVEQLGGQLTWMAHHGIGSAALKVSPPDLGPIEVRITVHGSAASVWFGAAQADTRSALEQALPRLHELFGAQGLALADATVSRESPREQRDSSSGVWGGAGAPAPIDSSTPGAAAQQHLGLLDLYA